MTLPPIQLLFKLDQYEKLNLVKNLTNFFNLTDKNKESLLEKFNFIQFSNIKNLQIDNQNQNLNENNTNQLLNTPSYSFILFTINNNNNNIIKDESKSDFKYHHKVELKDEREQVAARQIFYELSKNLPLFCKTNWIPTNILTITNTNIKTESKYIIRLNINCKNYDLMLMFYRLLFDKYPNFSKKNFSVFILTNEEEENEDESNIEFQFSLKYDENLKPYVLNDKVIFIYCVKSRDLFENAISLLNGLTYEILPNKIYSIYDPDGNQIYLIDSSLNNKNVLNTTRFTDYLNSDNNLVGSSLTSLSSMVSSSNNKSQSPVDSFFSSPNSNSSSVNSTTATNRVSFKEDSGRCSSVSLNNDRVRNYSADSSMKQLKINDDDDDVQLDSSVKNLINKFNIEQNNNNGFIRKFSNSKIEYANIHNMKTYYPVDEEKFVVPKARPASSLGHFVNYSDRSRNNNYYRVERPKSCTPFVEENIFNNIPIMNRSKNVNCCCCCFKNKQEDNYVFNNKNGKYIFFLFSNYRPFVFLLDRSLLTSILNAFCFFEQLNQKNSFFYKFNQNEVPSDSKSEV
jgi:hypothetical protein